MIQEDIDPLELLYAKTFLAAVGDLRRFAEAAHQSITDVKLRDVLASIEATDDD